jgi:hypothetical protein
VVIAVPVRAPTAFSRVEMAEEAVDAGMVTLAHRDRPAVWVKRVDVVPVDQPGAWATSVTENVVDDAVSAR